MGFFPFDSLRNAFIFGEVVGFLQEDEEDEEKEYDEFDLADDEEDEDEFW